MASNLLGRPGIQSGLIDDVEKQKSNATIEVQAEWTEQNLFARCNRRIETLAGLEARGIARVMPEERHGLSAASYLQMFALWFGMNLTVIVIPTGFLGPLLFNLGWSDCVWIVLVANIVGGLSPAYMVTFGAESGHRSMVLSRFFVGYWPAKLTSLLNVITQVGWGTIACIVAGQIISAVNGHNLSLAVGCVIAALCIGILCVFGLAILQICERYAWYLQAFALLVLIGSSGRDWDTSVVSVGDNATITANRCSFFSLLVAAVVGYGAIASDFFVYYPVKTDKRLMFLATWSGNFIANSATELIGVGIATGVANNPAWNQAYQISPGALVVACYDGLGGFGRFCAIILALGTIQNCAPSTYVAGHSIQTLGRYTRNIPRWMLCIFLMCVELVCSVAGRARLLEIFENFLPIMAYWVCPWLTIVVEEHVLFHVWKGVAFDWTIWEDRKKLPVGAAALLAWLVGWAGAIIGMAQVWYTGPIAAKIGGYGGDIGCWLSIAFAGLTYPLLRALELRYTGR